MKAFLILSLLITQSAQAGGGGGGCHYPDIETYTCRANADGNRQLKVMLSKYIDAKAPAFYASYAELDGKVLAYMGQIRTVKSGAGQAPLFQLKSTENQNVDAHFRILDTKRDTIALLSGYAGLKVSRLAMKCTYNYRIQCP